MRFCDVFFAQILMLVDTLFSQVKRQNKHIYNICYTCIDHSSSSSSRNQHQQWQSISVKVFYLMFFMNDTESRNCNTAFHLSLSISTNHIHTYSIQPQSTYMLFTQKSTTMFRFFSFFFTLRLSLRQCFAFNLRNKLVREHSA